MSHQLHDDMLSFLPETRCNARLYDGNIWLFALLLLLLFFDMFTTTERQRGGSDHYKGCNHKLLTDRDVNSPSIYIRMKVCAARGYSDLFRLTFLTQAGPSALLCDLGLLQTPQRVSDQEPLTDGVCWEPTKKMLRWLKKTVQDKVREKPEDISNKLLPLPLTFHS